MEQLFSDIEQWKGQEIIPHRKKTNKVITKIVSACCLEVLFGPDEETQGEHSTLAEMRRQGLEFEEAEVTGIWGQSSQEEETIQRKFWKSA